MELRASAVGNGRLMQKHRNQTVVLSAITTGPWYGHRRGQMAWGFMRSSHSVTGGMRYRPRYVHVISVRLAV